MKKLFSDAWKTISEVYEFVFCMIIASFGFLLCAFSIILPIALAIGISPWWLLSYIISPAAFIFGKSVMYMAFEVEE